jgi:hypothetical protein
MNRLPDYKLEPSIDLAYCRECNDTVGVEEWDEFCPFCGDELYDENDFPEPDPFDPAHARYFS